MSTADAFLEGQSDAQATFLEMKDKTNSSQEVGHLYTLDGNPCAQCGETSLTSSRPMTPAPISTMCSGTFSSDRAPVEDTMVFSSTCNA